MSVTSNVRLVDCLMHGSDQLSLNLRRRSHSISVTSSKCAVMARAAVHVCMRHEPASFGFYGQCIIKVSQERHVIFEQKDFAD